MNFIKLSNIEQEKKNYIIWNAKKRKCISQFKFVMKIKVNDQMWKLEYVIKVAFSSS